MACKNERIRGDWNQEGTWVVVVVDATSGPILHWYDRLSHLQPGQPCQLRILNRFFIFCASSSPYVLGHRRFGTKSGSAFRNRTGQSRFPRDQNKYYIAEDDRRTGRTCALESRARDDVSGGIWTQWESSNNVPGGRVGHMQRWTAGISRVEVRQGVQDVDHHRNRIGSWTDRAGFRRRLVSVCLAWHIYHP